MAHNLPVLLMMLPLKPFMSSCINTIQKLRNTQGKVNVDLYSALSWTHL